MFPSYQGGPGAEPGMKANILCFIVPILQLLPTEAAVDRPELGLGLHISCFSSDSNVQPTGLAPSYKSHLPWAGGMQCTILTPSCRCQPRAGPQRDSPCPQRLVPLLGSLHTSPLVLHTFLASVPHTVGPPGPARNECLRMLLYSGAKRRNRPGGPQMRWSNTHPHFAQLVVGGGTGQLRST